ncbi:hypothetical protein VZT92_022920 [Zoarces viviparus]|uniref:Macro domain-containing protein n=2 Tax=Zoarces viviparus TaxID=48416 RepID=A0AAW1E4X8_ZOAVI
MQEQQNGPDVPGTSRKTEVTQRSEPAAPTKGSPPDGSEDQRDDVASGGPIPNKENRGNVRHQVILYGRGWTTWDAAIQQHLTDLHQDESRASAGEKVEQMCKKEGGYLAPLLHKSGVAVAVVESPEPPRSKTQVGEWLTWWLVVLRTIKGRVVTVISPSKDYDSIVKMLATEIGAGPVTVGNKVKAAARSKNHQSELDAIASYIAGEAHYATNTDDLISTAGTMDSEGSTSDEGPVLSEEEKEGEEENGSPLSKSGGYQALPSSFSFGTPALVRKTLQDLEEDEPEQHRKEKSKKNHTDARGPEDYLPKLKEMPKGTRKYANQTGLTAYNHFGDPWDIDSHGLVVLTNSHLRPHITRFRKKLTNEGGNPDREELEASLRAYRETKSKVVVTSGGNSSHFAVLHVPIEKYQDGHDQDSYRDDIEEALEEGVNRASELSYKRIVICNDGARSGNLPWEVAEEAAMRVKKHLMTAVHAWSHIQELVIVTSVTQYQERKDKILGPLKKTEGPNNWRAGKPKYEDEEAPIHRAVIPRLPTEPDPKKEAAEQGSFRELISEPFRQEERPPQASSSHAKPSRKRETPTTAARSVTVQTDEEISEPKRSGNATTSQTESADLQGMQCKNVGEGATRFMSPDRSKTSLRTQARTQEPTQPPPLTPPQEGSGVDIAAESSDEEDTVQSLTSIEYEAPGGVRDLKQGSRKGKKNALPLLSVYSASQKMARVDQYGPMITKDGRKAYVPEVGQTGYDVPELWLHDIEGMKGTTVYATKGEWANFLMTPTYGSLAAATGLTSNFRTGYVAVVYDVMLRRLKKAAYQLAREEERALRRDISDSEEEQPITGQTPARSSNLTEGDEGLMKMQASTQSFNEFKKIKAMVANRDPKESVQEYLTRKWLMVKASSTNDEAKRLWLAHVTDQPMGPEETAEEHYRRLVLEDCEDEESQIEKARKSLEKGQTLTQAWYALRQAIPPDRSVQALRKLTKGLMNDIDFVTLNINKSTTEQIQETVRKWDLKKKHLEEKRERGSQPKPTAPRASYDGAGPPEGSSPSQAPRRPPGGFQRAAQGFQRGQGFQRQGGFPRPPPEPQRQGPRTPPVGKSGFLSSEEYNKLTTEQKQALRVSRMEAGSEGPRK